MDWESEMEELYLFFRLMSALGFDRAVSIVNAPAKKFENMNFRQLYWWETVIIYVNCDVLTEKMRS